MKKSVYRERKKLRKEADGGQRTIMRTRMRMRIVWTFCVIGQESEAIHRHRLRVRMRFVLPLATYGSGVAGRPRSSILNPNQARRP